MQMCLRGSWRAVCCRRNACCTTPNCTKSKFDGVRLHTWKDNMSRRRGSKRFSTTPLISAKLLAMSSATIALERLLFIATLKAMPCN